MQERIVDGLGGANLDRISRCPYSVYSSLIDEVVLCFDEALWGYREPVRHIEKVGRTLELHYPADMK